MGLPDLARQVRIIDAYRYDWLLEALIEVQDGFRPIDDGKFLQNLLQDQRIPPTQESVERALSVYQKLGQFDVDERTYKIPPFLGEDNYLLIESDRAFGATELTRPDPTKELELAARGGYSLVMVPEHPDTWWERIDPPVVTSPEQVMDVLAPVILDWTGEPIRRDLAVELGIFQDVEGHRSEHEGRPMERF